MKLRPIAAAGLLATVAAACPARTPSVGDPTSRPTATPTAAPTPEGTPTRSTLPSARRVAYVAEEGLFLYDVATEQIQQLLRGSGIKQPLFLNRETVAFLRDEGTGTTILSYDIRTRSLTTLHTVERQIQVWAARPDNEEFAYVVTGDDGFPQVRFRAMVGNQTTLVVTTLARSAGREFDIGDQMYLRYSPDGSRALVSFTPADGEPGEKIPDTAAQLQVRRSDGALDFAPPHAQGATQAVMSVDGKKVFFRSSRGARMWDAARRNTSTVPGKPPVWFNLAASLDGRYIAYDTGATTAKVRVELLDLRDGKKVQLGAQGRVSPVFANVRTVWTQVVQPCEPECFYPVVAGPEVISVDIRTGAEKKLKLPTLQGIAVFYA